MQQYGLWSPRVECCFCAYVDEVSGYWRYTWVLGKAAETRAAWHRGLVDCLLDVKVPEALLCFSDSKVLTHRVSFWGQTGRLPPSSAPEGEEPTSSVAFGALPL